MTKHHWQQTENYMTDIAKTTNLNNEKV